MNLYEQQMKKFFENSNIIHNQKYCGKTCIAHLDKELLVKLDFISTKISGQYNAIRASIINRIDGVVDKQVFCFKDILGVKHTNNPNFYDGVHPHIWDDQGKPKWYIYQPTNEDYKAISDMIDGYISMYQQNKNMELTEQIL